MKVLLKFVLSFTLLFSTTALMAQDNAGSETHDGFFLRFLLGYGYASYEEKDIIYGDLKMSGPSGIFSFQIGGAPVENLILFGEITGVSVSNPKVEWGSYSGTTQDTTMSFSDVGAGVCYYIMPANIYLSGVLSFPMASVEVNGTTGSTNRGVGINLYLGKEWWVSENWGLGVALVGSMFKTKSDEGVYGTKDATGWYGGICFSATYN